LAEGTVWDSEAKRRRALEKERSCCERHDEGWFCCNRRHGAVQRAAVCPEKEREASTEDRVSARQR